MIYQTIYNLIDTYLFAGATSVEWLALVNTILSTIGTLFVFAIPFMVVSKIIRLICGG